LEKLNRVSVYEMDYNGMQSCDKVTHNCKFSNDEEDSSSDDGNTDSVKTTDHDEETIVSMQAGKKQSIFTNTTQQDNTVSADSCKDITLRYRNKDLLMNKRDCNVESDSDLAIKYRQHCHQNGFMDSEEHFRDEIKKITRKYGWKYFKVLSDADYHYSSPFAECMMDHFGYEKLERSEKESTWEKVKRDVFQAMQIARSGATQSLKRVFLCKLFYISLDNKNN
jgi:hypothetical protein